jgi:pyruvate-ferredoxin/flavodoxin oxidoreductase
VLAVCPHAAIRIKAYDPKHLAGARNLQERDAKGKEFAGMKFTVQVAPEDCTGCGACVQRCPAKNGSETKPHRRKAINMASQIPLREARGENFDFFLSLPETDPKLFNRATVKGSQFCRPLFEFSGACAGCGETPYVKLLTQLFGDRCLIANATGCSSIYGGNLPTTPYTTAPTDAARPGPTRCSRTTPSSAKFSQFALKENRFRILTKSKPENARILLEKADKFVADKFEMLTKLSGM